MYCVVKLRQVSGKDRQEMALKRKALKLKHLFYLTYSQTVSGQVRQVEVRGRCVGSLCVTLGSL